MTPKLREVFTEPHFIDYKSEYVSEHHPVHHTTGDGRDLHYEYPSDFRSGELRRQERH